jgi:hypothetical protein
MASPFESDDFLEKIKGFGILGYSADKIIHILDIQQSQVAAFLNEFYKRGSKLATAYQKGKDVADYTIDLKLWEQAKRGDLKALEAFENRRYLNQKLEEKEVATRCLGSLKPSTKNQ